MAGLLKLGNDQVQATVSPEWGGSLMGLRARVGDRWVALMPEAGLPGCDLAAASFVMAPYSNRIAEGRFSFGGVVHQLQNGANHAIHGDVRKRRWTLVHADLGEVRLGFASTEFPDINWPWAWMPCS